jgi:hypothetical protein
VTVRGTFPVWTPEAVARLRELVAERKTDEQMGLELGRTRAAVEAIRRKHDIKSMASGSTTASAVPDDFRTLGPTLSIKGASRHYGVVRETVRRWHRECGTSALAVNPIANMGENRRIGPPKYARNFSILPVQRLPGRACTTAASAQLTIQRRMPCFHARTLNPKAPADQWIVGGRRMSEAEMISMAERYQARAAA